MDNLIEIYNTYKSKSLVSSEDIGSTSSLLDLVWKKSSNQKKESYLSYLLTQWSLKPDRMNLDLKVNKFIDWETARSGTPIWMDMFLKNSSSLRLNTKSGRLAWSFWISRLGAKIEQAQRLWTATDSLSFSLQPNSTSISKIRTDTLINSIDSVIQSVLAESNKEQSDWDVVRCFMKFADQQEILGVDRVFNQVSGMLCKSLALHIAKKRDTPQDIITWWDERGNILHHPLLSEHDKKRYSGLVGRPEYLFEITMISLVEQKSLKTQQSDIFNLADAFWRSCRVRFDDTNNLKGNDIFLPSFYKLVEDINQLPPNFAVECKTYIEKASLCAQLGSWPWLDKGDESNKKRSRKI